MLKIPQPKKELQELRKRQLKNAGIKLALICGGVYFYTTQLGLNLQAQEIMLGKEYIALSQRSVAHPPPTLAPSPTPKLDDAQIKIEPLLGGVLKRKSGEIIKASNKYNVDPYLMYAIIRHETENGTSPMIRNQNNPAGLYNSEIGKFSTFNTLQDGLNAMAWELDALKKKCVTSIPDIGAIWCPKDDPKDKKKVNKYWIPKVTEYYQEVTK